MTMVSRLWMALMLALSIAVVSTAALAQDKTVTVRFPRGASGTTIDGTIRGNQAINYVIGVSAGQRMSIQLDTDNTSNYFNITGPGASAAAYNSSMDGNSTTFSIPSSGNWVITVYLMRNAARRNERANFELSIYVEGAAASTTPRPRPVAPASNAVDMSQMPRFCAGEASAKFGVRPQDITTNMAYKSGNRYVSQGWVDQADGSTTFFNCWFDLDGNFQSVN